MLGIFSNPSLCVNLLKLLFSSCYCLHCTHLFAHVFFASDMPTSEVVYVVAIIDDNYIIGPKEDVFRACEDFAADLTEVGLEL